MGLKRLTLEDMQKVAEERGGRCLSTSYTNVKTKLTWECKEGHKWQALPNSVRQGSWCPKCAKLNKVRPYSY